MAGHFRRAVRNGGRSAAQVGVGAARVCCRLLPRCLLVAGRSFILLLIAGAVSCSRAEVVDRDDTVKHRWVVTVDFGPVFCVPLNIAKVIVVLL